MNKPIVGTYWTRNGDTFRVIAPAKLETKDAQDGNWSPAVAFRKVGLTGKGIPGGTVRVLSEKDFRAQYRIR